MKRYILPVLALFCAGLLLWWALGSTLTDTFYAHLPHGIGDALNAIDGHVDTTVLFSAVAFVLLFGAWRLWPRRGSSAFLIGLFLVGCASTQPAATPSPVSTSTSPCITSSWRYAAIIDGSCTPDGLTDRITWSEWWALQLADKIAEMREP